MKIHRNSSVKLFLNFGDNSLMSAEVEEIVKSLKNMRKFSEEFDDLDAIFYTSSKNTWRCSK